MHWNPLQVSLDTLIAASPLLGHELEDRASIRDAQRVNLARDLTFTASTRLRSASQRDLFCVAPLDLLVSGTPGRRQFHLLELNGTGIGGLTNLSNDAVCAIMTSLAETCSSFDDPDGVLLLAISGKESESAPRKNRLMHEKLLFVEAMREGLHRRFGGSCASNLDMLERTARDVRAPQPTCVLGYIKDLLAALELAPDGTLWLHGRRVMGAVNDRFCRNVLQRFGDRVDLNRLKTVNRCFAAGSDKGIAYSLMNEFAQQRLHRGLPSEIRYAHAHCRTTLITTVLSWLTHGRQVVIKPHGTGLGHGIEFFLDPNESIDAIVGRIDQSLKQTEEYYSIAGGALPYTVCDYVDACRIEAPNHPLCGHKYELRVVVYRQGDSLLAFPSIAKIARERCELGNNVRRALINNITASGDTAKVCGTDYMLPLCDERTLEILDLSTAELEELCAACTGYVRYVLDQVEDQPERFGLPATTAPVAHTPRHLIAA